MLIILLAALRRGVNLKFTLEEEENVTAAYLVSKPDFFIFPTKFTSAFFPLSNSHDPIDPEPSITRTTSSFDKLLLICLPMPKKLDMNLSAVTLSGGTV